MRLVDEDAKLFESRQLLKSLVNGQPCLILGSIKVVEVRRFIIGTSGLISRSTTLEQAIDRASLCMLAPEDNLLSGLR